MKISALINTLNEEENIENCLKSLCWVDEIILVDMYSDDKTIEIARKYTDKVFFFERMGYSEPARAFALSQVTGDWVIVLDADEMIPFSLAQNLKSIAHENDFDAVWIPRKNYLFGQQIEHTGFGLSDDLQMRFFKKNVMTYTSTIHKFVNLDPSARVKTISDMSLCIWHFSYIDITNFIEKVNRYTTVEAKQLHKNNEQRSYINILASFFKEFVYRFFLKKGFKDGFDGLIVSLMMGFYRLVTGLKLKLMYRLNNSDTHRSIMNIYKEEAKKIINQYESNR